MEDDVKLLDVYVGIGDDSDSDLILYLKVGKDKVRVTVDPEKVDKISLSLKKYYKKNIPPMR